MCKNKLLHIALSFRTERSVVKNLGNLHVVTRLYATEILRFALNDKMRLVIVYISLNRLQK